MSPKRFTLQLHELVPMSHMFDVREKVAYGVRVRLRLELGLGFKSVTTTSSPKRFTFRLNYNPGQKSLGHHNFFTSFYYLFETDSV